jgi:hypothetical protein
VESFSNQGSVDVYPFLFFLIGTCELTSIRSVVAVTQVCSAGYREWREALLIMWSKLLYQC